MTTQPSSTVPSDDATSGSDLRSDGGAGAAYGAAQRRLWQVVAMMSSPLARVAQGLDRSLGDAALERGPWVIVGVIAGIAAWFVLPGPVAWMAAIGVALGVAVAGVLLLRMDRVPDLALALLALGLAVAFGIGLIWARSTSVGEPAIEHPQ
ncbi:MAG: metal-binding protein, partial [Pseudomonadota bacterium]|nr:metal-binding protein [Pseudomonadota bacterium]